MSRSVIAMCARLVVFSLAMQVTAVDHWNGAHGEIIGVIGTNQHTMHCHGAVASCGAAEATMNVAETRPMVQVPAVWTQRSSLVETSSNEGISIPPLDQPPRLLSTA